MKEESDRGRGLYQRAGRSGPTIAGWNRTCPYARFPQLCPLHRIRGLEFRLYGVGSIVERFLGPKADSLITRLALDEPVWLIFPHSANGSVRDSPR